MWKGRLSDDLMITVLIRSTLQEYRSRATVECTA